MTPSVTLLSDDHRDPTTRVSDAVRIELAAERLIDRWERGHDPRLTESLDLDALLRRILATTGQCQCEAIDRARRAVREQAEIRARHDITPPRKGEE